MVGELAGSLVPVRALLMELGLELARDSGLVVQSVRELLWVVVLALVLELMEELSQPVMAVKLVRQEVPWEHKRGVKWPILK